jgi:hypothetical protein
MGIAAGWLERGTEARSTEDMAGLEAPQALQDSQGLVGYILGPSGPDMLRLVALEHHIEGLGVAYTAVEAPKSAAEVPSMGCSGVVNQSYRNHHVAACQFCPSFQNWIYPWLTPNWLSRFHYRHLLRHSPLSCRKCALELACKAPPVLL